MELFQLIVSSFFSLVAAMSILFIAARAYSIGSDVAEMKELLREVRREMQTRADLSIPNAAPAHDSKLGEWPSVTDPRYNSDHREQLPYALRPAPEDVEQSETANRPKGW